MIPSSSSARRRSDSVRGLIPAHECSSSEKRRGPSERSCTRRAVHLAPMISAHAATEQVSSWIAFIVRMEKVYFLLSRVKRREKLNPRGTLSTSRAMIDLHSHILPGLDDGPATIESSLELARAAVEDGIEVMAATPHVRVQARARRGGGTRSASAPRSRRRRKPAPRAG